MEGSGCALTRQEAQFRRAKNTPDFRVRTTRGFQNEENSTRGRVKTQVDIGKLGCVGQVNLQD